MVDMPKPNGGFPLALDALAEPVISSERAQVGRVVQASRESPRGRIILPFHKTAADACHRMLNALQPGSYIRPHRHLSPPKSETILVLKGSICFVIFGSGGIISDHFTLTAGSDRFGIDVEPGAYHTLIALETDTVVFEIKPGPFSPAATGDYADWAPEEGHAAAGPYLDKLRQKIIG